MSQSQQILDYLKQGNKLTPMQALHKFGCFRLSARIYEIRRAGYRIGSHLVDSGKKRYSVYYMETGR